MPHAPTTPSRRRAPYRRCPRPAGDLVARLRTEIAGAHGLDLAALREAPAAPVLAAGGLHLLGAGSPSRLRTAAEVLARVDELAHELVARMRERGWSEGAAPEAVTSVLAASVPAAEAVLLRAARSQSR